VAKPEWGAKHICHSCGSRYYDLQSSPIICPKCNTQFDPEAFLKSRRTRVAAVEEVAAAKAVAKKPAAKAAAEEPEEAAVEEPEEVVEEVAEVELEADDATVSLESLKGEDEAEVADAPDADLGDDVETADDEDENDSNVLLEDASELGDEDVGEVVDIAKEEDPNT